MAVQIKQLRNYCDIISGLQCINMHQILFSLNSIVVKEVLKYLMIHVNILSGYVNHTTPQKSPASDSKTV